MRIIVPVDMQKKENAADQIVRAVINEFSKVAISQNFKRKQIVELLNELENSLNLFKLSADDFQNDFKLYFDRINTTHQAITTFKQAFQTQLRDQAHDHIRLNLDEVHSALVDVYAALITDNTFLPVEIIDSIGYILDNPYRKLMGFINTYNKLTAIEYNTLRETHSINLAKSATFFAKLNAPQSPEIFTPNIKDLPEEELTQPSTSPLVSSNIIEDEKKYKFVGPLQYTKDEITRLVTVLQAYLVNDLDFLLKEIIEEKIAKFKEFCNRKSVPEDYILESIKENLAEFELIELPQDIKHFIKEAFIAITKLQGEHLDVAIQSESKALPTIDFEEIEETAGIEETNDFAQHIEYINEVRIPEILGEIATTREELLYQGNRYANDLSNISAIEEYFKKQTLTADPELIRAILPNIEIFIEFLEEKLSIPYQHLVQLHGEMCQLFMDLETGLNYSRPAKRKADNDDHTVANKRPRRTGSFDGDFGMFNTRTTTTTMTMTAPTNTPAVNRSMDPNNNNR